MGGIVRSVRKVFKKITSPITRVADEAFEELIEKPVKRATKETAKAAGIIPSNKEIAEAQRAAEAAAAAQANVNVVDAPGDDPDDVIYAGEQKAKGKKKKRRKGAGTILTGSQGVMGDAPTEKKSLLGG